MTDDVDPAIVDQLGALIECEIRDARKDLTAAGLPHPAVVPAHYSAVCTAAG